MSRLWPALPLLLLLSATTARASGAPHTHDGFYLRLQAGVGGTRANQRRDLTLKGGSGAVNVEIGGALARNFILYGKLFGTGTPGPDFEVGDVTLENEDDDVNLSFGGFGVGATYYFMPVNLYVSARHLRHQHQPHPRRGRAAAAASVGGGLHLGVGKEWWVGDQWGLGVGAELALTRADSDDETSGDWEAGSIALFFSATFN